MYVRLYEVLHGLGELFFQCGSCSGLLAQALPVDITSHQTLLADKML